MRSSSVFTLVWFVFLVGAIGVSERATGDESGKHSDPFWSALL